MNRERAKELAPIIQAFGEGKVIEARNLTQPWHEVGLNNLSFHDDVEYRIKPEPVTYYAQVYRNDNRLVLVDHPYSREEFITKGEGYIKTISFEVSE